MTSRIVPVSTVTDADLRAWRDLSARAVEPNVFYDPEFLVPTQRYFGTGEGIHLLVVEDRDRWLAVLPLELVPGDSRWPLRHASNAGPALQEYTSLGTPLLDDGDAPRAARELVDALRDNRALLGHAIVLHLLSVDGPAGRILSDEIHRQRLAVHVWGNDARAAVDYTQREISGWSDLVSANRARKVRKELRQLEKEAADSGLAAPELAQSDAAVGDYLAFEMRTWKGDPLRDGPAFARRDGGAEWVTSVFDGLRAKNGAYLLTLSAAPDTLHMALYLRSGSTVFGWYDAYAPDAARRSPGTLGRLLAAGHFAGVEGIRTLDMCMDPSRFPDQTSHYPDRVRITSLTVALGPWPFSRALDARRLLGHLRHRLDHIRAPHD
ncbi:GNAT family N-acetyltransferase [Cellulomonas sp. P24]|uniref:GNAT family N-acetyltransferase n=1 Tax=Cellulomonas sp. P24 TaxID=2885206 RepID=UPI00216B1D50|nr:GNAT family N-acetyltransferase [Cellulomonas sp. P24]MCR6493772.1 GNAT family N-acetyltransferase [Cellulomonas sp. P24]